VKRRGLKSRFVGLRGVIDFKSYNGKMYLNYLSVDSKINWYDIDTNELKFETVLNQQLLINAEVHTNAFYYLVLMRSPVSRLTLLQDIWESYNVIKESPLD